MTTPQENNHPQERVLYLIPVPLSDDTAPDRVLPAPVLETVKSLKCFFVENQRSARRFLKAVDKNIDIDTIEMHVLDEHTTELSARQLSAPLMQSGRAGMLSEAGCPCIADPGAMIVDIARSRGLRIVPLTGPSSILLSLMASGFNGQNFAFNGYLPYDNSSRRKKIREMLHRMASERQTQIFIETPYRNNRLLDELLAVLPPATRLCVACELTSPREVIVTQTVEQWKKKRYDFSKRPAIFLLSC